MRSGGPSARAWSRQNGYMDEAQAYSPPIHSSRPTWRQFLLKRRSSGFQSHLMNTLSSGVWKHMKGVTGAELRSGRSSNKAPACRDCLSFFPFWVLRGFLVKFGPPFACRGDASPTACCGVRCLLQFQFRKRDERWRRRLRARGAPGPSGVPKACSRPSSNRLDQA